MGETTKRGRGEYKRTMRDKYDKSMFYVCEDMIMKSISLYNYYVLVNHFFWKEKLSDNIYKYIKQYWVIGCVLCSMEMFVLMFILSPHFPFNRFIPFRLLACPRLWTLT